VLRPLAEIKRSEDDSVNPSTGSDPGQIEPNVVKSDSSRRRARLRLHSSGDIVKAAYRAAPNLFSRRDCGVGPFLRGGAYK